MRVAVLTLALWSSSAPAAEEALPSLPPRGRPLHFDEERSPIGSFQTPTVRAEPTELQAEDPLTYTVRVTASGKVFRPPVRPDLHRIPDFSEQFEIDNVGEGDGRLDAKTWEFAYRLRPRNAAVKAIPGFPYAFFTPGFLPAHQGYQTRFVPAVELTVKPRAEVKPDTVQGSQPLPRGPDALYEVVSSHSQLRHRSAEGLPSALVLLILLAAPPIACLAWYLCWRRFNPSAARLALRRQSRAGRAALLALDRVSAPGGADAARIVANYLRHRHELPCEEPTPEEVARHLRARGVPSTTAVRAAEFFRSCDAQRFAPQVAHQQEVLSAARRLIVSLEELEEKSTPRMVSGSALLALLWLLCWTPIATAARIVSPDRYENAALHFDAGLKGETPALARQAFQKAARIYEQGRTAGVADPFLCRSEGNAWLLSGDTARSILAYRRGLRLDPGDRALRECLAFAREQVVYPSPGNFARPPVEQRPPWLPRLSPSFQFVLAGAVYVIGWLAFTRWWMTRRHGLLAVSGVAFLIFLLLGASLVWQDWQRQVEAQHPLVVIKEDGVLLYRGNGLAYPRYETPLNAGVEARLLFERGDWLQIELAGGEVGWVPRSYALVDTP